MATRCNSLVTHDCRLLVPTCYVNELYNVIYCCLSSAGSTTHAISPISKTRRKKHGSPFTEHGAPLYGAVEKPKSL